MSGEGSSWWSSAGSAVGSIWSKAKETGSNVYEFTANDMSEVATSLKQDVIAPSASALKHRLQPYAQFGGLTDSVTNMLGNVSEYLAPEPPTVQYLSRFGEDRLTAIQTSPETYTQHASDAHFAEWSEGFVLEEHTHEIGEILVGSEALRATHTALVPGSLSYPTFWRVYYYRTHLFQLEKQKHEELLSRADTGGEDEELKWSDEEEEEEEEEGAGETEGKTGEDSHEIVENQELEERVYVPEQLQGSPEVAEEAPQEELKGTPGTGEAEPEQVSTSTEPTPETQSLEGKQEGEGEEEGVSEVASTGPVTTTSSSESTERMVSSEGHAESSVKADLSSEDSYEMIKEKDIAPCDEEFERELDQMIEHIQLEETAENEDNDWEDWD